MTDLGILLILAIETFLLADAYRRSSLVLFPTIYFGYLLYCQVIYELVVKGLLRNDFLAIYSIGGTERNEFETQLLYGAFFAFLWFISRGIRFTGSLKEVFASGIFRQFTSVIVLALIIYALVFSLSIDWTVAWSNSVYLSMTDPRLVFLRPTELDSLLLSLLLPSGILAGCLAGATLARREFGLTVVLSVYAGATSTYFLGAHQRGAAVIPVVMVTAILAVQSRPSRTICAALAAYAAFAYVAALVGRGSGFHGISSIPASAELVMIIDTEGFLDNLLTNSAEGIFVFAESISFPASYPIQYEVLSFLPTPSVIDGFSSIRDLYLVKLHPYVPFSGYAEALKFGPIAVLALVSCIFGIVRLNRSMATVSPFSFVVVNALTFSGFVTLGTYPVRSGLRTIWVAYAIAIASLVFKPHPTAKPVKLRTPAVQKR